MREPFEYDVSLYEIGGLDAWRDDAAQIEQAFVPIHQFLQLPEAHRCFLCGRRGSGKSAIAKMAEKRTDWDYCRVIEGEAQQYGAYMDLVDQLIGQQRTGLAIDVKRFVQLLWRYVLQLVIMQTVYEYASKDDRPRDENAIRTIRSFLDRHHRLTTTIGLLLHDTFQEAMANVPAGPGPATAEAFGTIQRSLNATDFQAAVNAVPIALGNSRVLIVFDTIESYKIHNEAMKQGLRGVVGALIGLLSEQNFKAIGVRFFLPAEILEDVTAEIPAKSLASTVFLRWRAGDIFTMISKRYLAMLRRTQLLPPERLLELDDLVKRSEQHTLGSGDGRNLRQRFWYENRFFPTVIPNRLHLTEDCWAYVLRHTQRRPRELIYVLNRIIRKAYRRRELPYISAESVVAGLHDSKTLQLLVSEALSPYEGHVDKFVNRARSAFSDKPRVFSYRDLKRFSKAFYELGPVAGIDSDRFIEFLLRSGVIGCVTRPLSMPRGNSPYCVASFEYLMQGNLPQSPDFQYCVHPAVGDYFHMKSGEMGAIYPRPDDDRWLEEEVGIAVEDL